MEFLFSKSLESSGYSVNENFLLLFLMTCYDLGSYSLESQSIDSAGRLLACKFWFYHLEDDLGQAVSVFYTSASSSVKLANNIIWGCCKNKEVPG